MSALYKIVYKGNLKGEVSASEVTRRFSTAFKITAEKAEKIIQSNRPLVLKNSLPLNVAEEYKTKLEYLGLEVEIYQMEGNSKDISGDNANTVQPTKSQISSNDYDTNSVQGMHYRKSQKKSDLASENMGVGSSRMKISRITSYLFLLVFGYLSVRYFNIASLLFSITHLVVAKDAYLTFLRHVVVISFLPYSIVNLLILFRVFHCIKARAFVIPEGYSGKAFVIGTGVVTLTIILLLCYKFGMINPPLYSQSVSGSLYRLFVNIPFALCIALILFAEWKVFYNTIQSKQQDKHQ